MTAHTGSLDTVPDPMMQLASHLGLSRGTATVLRLIYWLPLASADDIAGILSRSASSVLKAIRGLRRARMLEPAQLGCTMGQRQRWYLSYECLERAGLSGGTGHDEVARCRLLELLPALEQVYQAIGSVRTMGNFCEFQWLDALGIDGPSCDAVCRFQRGWVALFWCGSLLSERILTERLLRLPLDCQALAVGSPRPWPDLLLLVVADEWEREVAVRVLEDLGLEGRRQYIAWPTARSRAPPIPVKAGAGCTSRCGRGPGRFPGRVRWRPLRGRGRRPRIGQGPGGDGAVARQPAAGSQGRRAGGRGPDRSGGPAASWPPPGWSCRPERGAMPAISRPPGAWVAGWPGPGTPRGRQDSDRPVPVAGSVAQAAGAHGVSCP